MSPQDDQMAGSARSFTDQEDRSHTAPLMDVLDWDACIECPPPRPSGTVKVRLQFRGRDQPIAVDTPQDDETRKP